MVAEFVTGRLRGYRHVLLMLLGAAAAWGWFGAVGSVFVLLWAWPRRPRAGRLQRVLLGPIASARLGRLLTSALAVDGQWLEVFCDELPPAQLAALRRQLKQAVSAGDGTQDVEPV